MSLRGGLSFYRKFRVDMAKRTRPVISLLKQGVKLLVTPAIEAIARTLIEKLSGPPVLVYPGWDAVDDNSRRLLLYYEASVEGFGVTFEQEEKGGSIRPIAFFSRATHESERHWIPLDLETGSTVWGSSVVILRGTTFRFLFRPQGARELRQGC